MKKDILFIAGTHGDEPIGVEVIKKIDKTKLGRKFDWIIGNLEALKKKKRYTDADLNRSAPGEKNSKEHESRRAVEILELAKDYKYVIDIHGSKKKTGIFCIVTNPKKRNYTLVGMLNIENVVYWPSISKELKGPLSEYFHCGIEIECGPKDSKDTKDKLEKIVTQFLNDYSQGFVGLDKKRYFEVYGSLENKIDKNLEEFKLVESNGEKFYPLLIGSYKEVTCYKMKKIKLFFN